MNQKNIVSIILALIFMLNCFVFFTVGASPEQESSAPTVTSAPTGIEPEPQQPTGSTNPSQEPSDVQPSDPVVDPTTSTTTTTAPSTTPSTTTNTVADPVYTTTTVPPTYQYDEYGYAITDPADTTAPITTKEGEKITEPTTIAKIVTDYSKQYNWLKWVSFVGMILSLGGLVVLNVMYKSQPSKSKRK